MDQALVVGVSRYSHVPPIRENQDVAGVHAVLADPNVCAYPPDRIHVLSEQDATRERVLEALEHLGREARASRGRTFFYFSGHGGRDAASGQAYLIPVDARRNEYPTTAISAKEIGQRLTNDGETTVVLDCCYSGAMGAAIDPTGTALSALDDSLRGQIASGNRVVLAASRPDSLSYSSRLAPHGGFTGHLLDGLRGKASTDGLTVNVHELFNYVQKQTLHERRGEQRATFIANVDGFFTLARYPQPQVQSEQFEKDVYISYDYNDPIVADWVEGTLQPDLLREGLTVHESNNAGADILAFEEEATAKSRYILAVVTAAALKDPKSHISRTMAILQAIHTRTPRFIPLLREQIPNLHGKAVGMFGPIELHEANLMLHKRQMTRLIDRLKKPPHQRPR